LTSTKGAAARGPLRWIACARSSFPVPVAPVISTVARSRGMIRDARSSASRIGALSPTIREKSYSRRSASASRARAVSDFTRSARSFTQSRSRSRSSGSAKYSAAPRRTTPAAIR
jgi:hypothetical protein